MENPLTWGPVEKTIYRTLQEIRVDEAREAYGPSTPRRIADALRAADLLAESPTTTKEDAMEPENKPADDLIQTATTFGREVAAEVETLVAVVASIFKEAATRKDTTVPKLLASYADPEVLTDLGKRGYHSFKKLLD